MRNNFILVATFVALGSSPSASAFKENIKDWTLEEKVGQLLMIGFRDPQEVIEAKAGGAVLFSWNMKSVDAAKKLTDTLKDLARKNLAAPLFIATDHEGGKVLRLRKGLTQFPDAAAVGAMQSPYTAFQVGKSMGMELSSLGINMNLAPVLDLGNARSFLENRIWSESPESVGELTSAYIKGLLSAGVFPVAKHFPGHGNSSSDSHFALPVIKKDFTRLWKEDLEPFREVIANDVPGIMTAHVELPSIDRGPASLSKTFVEDILREKMGFKGLVMTDDLEMGGVAARDGTSPADLGLKALQAGTDVILVVWSKTTQRKMIQRLVRAVQEGELSQEWLDKKVAHILALKKRHLSFSGEGESNPFWRENLRRPESLQLAESIRYGAIQWLGGNPESILPRLGSFWNKGWAVALPQGFSIAQWKKLRSQDRLHALKRRPDPTDIKNLQNFFRKSVASGDPLIVVTPPRASSSEELFLLLRGEIAGLMLKKKDIPPVLWVHQGPKPVTIRRDPASLDVGILSLYSSSPQSLEALMSYLKHKTQSRLTTKR